MPPRYQSRVSYGEGNTGARDYSQATGEQIDEEVRRLLVDAYQLAGTILRGDRDKLEVLAKGLLEYETFDRSRIKEIVEHGRPDKSTAKRSPAARQENAGAKPAWFIGSHRARNGGSDLDRTR